MKHLVFLALAIFCLLIDGVSLELYANHDLICIDKQSIEKSRMLALDSVKHLLQSDFVTIHETDVELYAVMDRNLSSFMNAICGDNANITIVLQDYNKVLKNERSEIALKNLEVGLVDLHIPRSFQKAIVETPNCNGPRPTELITRQRIGTDIYRSSILDMSSI